MNPTSYVHCNYIEKGMIIPRVNGGIVKPRIYGEKPCVSHPLKNPYFGWGQLFCWVVGGWQACPHTRSTSWVIHSRGQGKQQGMFFHSPILCIIFGSPPHAQASVLFGSRKWAEERVLSTVNHDFLYRAIHARETVGMCVFPLPIWGGHFLLMDL